LNLVSSFFVDAVVRPTSSSLGFESSIVSRRGRYATP
jgi:hypothetical protein